MPQNKKTTNRNTKTMGIWIIILSLFISELLIYAWARVQCIHVGYEIAEAIQQSVELKDSRKNLLIELARLKSPERISNIARERLELSTPLPEQIVVVK